MILLRRISPIGWKRGTKCVSGWKEMTRTQWSPHSTLVNGHAIPRVRSRSHGMLVGWLDECGKETGKIGLENCNRIVLVKLVVSNTGAVR